MRPKVWDIDLFVDQLVSGNNTTLNTGAVDAIHARGGHVICYVDAGTWENWRADAGEFPESVLGKHNGWPGERWLDIRPPSTLRPIMTRRVQKCARGRVRRRRVRQRRRLHQPHRLPADGARTSAATTCSSPTRTPRGLSVGLKNDLGQIPKLKPYFDFAINEQCMQYSECGALRALHGVGKPVFEVEYRSQDLHCGRSNSWS